jgi:hypothetical protein
VSGPVPPAEALVGEPSWLSALSEADAASRHLRSAAPSLERLSRELRALRAWSETNARLDLAYALTDGPDGGVLGAVLAAASEPASDAEARSAAQALLERLTFALGLEPVGQRGELLTLGDEELAELEVRGSRARGREGGRGLYRVVRPGWLLEAFVVTRPVVELAPAGGEEEEPPETATGAAERRR